MIQLRLLERDAAHLAQFSEYAVLLDGTQVGTVTGGAHTRFSEHRGRHVVTDRTWIAATTDGKATGHVATRREALEDLLRLLGDVRVTCSYCVQWRCKTHPEAPLDSFDECDPNFGCEMEPYWPDGSVATITEPDICARCAVTMERYHAEHPDV